MFDPLETISLNYSEFTLFGGLCFAKTSLPENLASYTSSFVHEIGRKTTQKIGNLLKILL